MGIFDRARHRPIRRLDDGTYAVDLDPPVRELVGSFIDQLRDLLDTDSALLERLFPPPYGDDAERNEGYAVLAGAELREQRHAALDLVSTHLDDEVLDEEQLLAWMRSLNDIRLVMGTMLGVTDDSVEPELDEEDAAAYSMYEFFGYLLEMIVSALSE